MIDNLSHLPTSQSCCKNLIRLSTLILVDHEEHHRPVSLPLMPTHGKGHTLQGICETLIAIGEDSQICIPILFPTLISNFIFSICLSGLTYMKMNPTITTKSIVKVKVAQLCLTFCDPTDCMYSPWNSPGQNTGVGSLSLLQGIFPIQGLNSGLPHCRQILYQLSHKGSPRILE